MTVQLCASCRAELPGGGVCPKCGRDAAADDASTRPTPVPSRDLFAGDVVDGHWKLLEKLGEGGMGTVYLATDLHLDRRVAIKFLHHELVGSELSRTRFEREAKLAAQLDHPNIVPIFGYGTHEYRSFIVMKFVEGESLEKVISTRARPFTWPEARALVAPLLDGLGHLHARGLVHRDVKPQNVVVGRDGRLTLLDFGLMREVTGEATQPGMVVGTLRYMAPEQLVGANVDARADLYAVGLVLFQMLSGRHAFLGDSLSIARKKLEEDAPSLRLSGAHFPLAVERAMASIIAREPEKRPASAAEVLRLLDEAFAAPAPRSSRVKWSLGALAALVVGALVVAFGSSRPSTTATTSEVADSGGLAITAAETPKVTEPIPSPFTTLEPVDAGQGTEALVDAGTSDRRPAVKKGPTKVRLVRVAVLTRLDSQTTFAELEVDGQRVGETPIQLELSAGAHQFRVIREGFPSLTKTITIRNAPTDRVVIDLVR